MAREDTEEKHMQKRILALLLVLALGCSLLATAAFAEEDTETAAPVEETREDGESPGEEALPSLTETSGAQQSAPAAGLEDGTTVGAENPELTVPQPDKVGQLSFANLETRVRENNLTIQMLEASIASIDAKDFDKMQEDLRKRLNNIAKLQYLVLTTPPEYTDAILGEIGMEGATYSSLQASYDALKDTFDDLKDGKIQADAAAAIRQLENAQDQLVMGAETLYVSLLELDAKRESVQRTVTALSRTVTEMELRYSMGQISALQLQQVKSGRTQAQSGLETLKMNLDNYTAQLESMVGAEIAGELTLSAQPAVPEKKIAAMDYEKDLAASKENSYDLFAAQRDLEDAKEAYRDACKEYYSGSYNRKSAEHTWEAAQYTYQVAVQSHELKFRTVFNAVADCRQALRAAETALALQQDTYKSMELKYQQGTISKNALLDAKDDLDDAQYTADAAERNLFTAWRNYQWAVEKGILN